MKTYKNIYGQIVSFENIYNAYLLSSRHKRFKIYVLRFETNLGDNILSIQNSLLSGSYQPADYSYKKVYDPKERDISVLAFRDRVVETAINNTIEPMFDPTFYFHSYACRVGKGTHLASETLNNWIYAMYKKYNVPIYALKGDIHSFFKSIHGHTLFEIISSKIDDPYALNLIYTFITHTPDLEGYDNVNKIGLPIGNVTS